MNKENLTEEQKVKLKKLRKKFALNMIAVVLLYFAFLSFANTTILIINKVYMHNPQFTFLALFGTAIIGMFGMVGTVEERRKYFAKEIKAITST